MNDVELLEQHRNGNDQAFAEIVQRHIGWVFGMARRRLRDAHLSEDVAQAVFILLHRKAPRFPADGALIRWLHKTAWYTTRVAERNQRRRAIRETEAAMARPTTTESLDQSEWTELAPLLDQMIGRLSRSDREAVLLRYYRDLSFAQVAAELGSTEEAARKRVERAVDKLRRFASEKGLMVSGATLALNLASSVRLPTPPGLLASTVGAVTTHGIGASASITTLVKGTIIMMNLTKILSGTVALIACLVLAGTIWAVLPNTPIGISSRDNGGQGGPPVQYQRLAPFNSVRWRGQTPEVRVNGTWYELKAVEDTPADQIVSFLTSSKDLAVQKHFSEDLVEVMTRMGHAVGTTVKLDLITLDTKQPLSLPKVPMTAANRADIVAVPDATLKGTVTLFPAMRWSGDVAQVQTGPDRTWYELVAVDGRAAAQVFDFAKKTYGDAWQTQLQQSSVDLMKRMGDVNPNKVDVRTLDTNESVSVYENVFEPPSARSAPAGPQPGIKYPRLSPFTAVRWADDGYQVQLDGRWYDLLAINDVQFSQIMQFARDTYGENMMHKRIDEDLVEVLTTMGKDPGKAIKLDLRSVDTDETVTRQNVQMTENNRRAVLIARQGPKK